MKKRIVASVLAVVMAASLVACGGKGGNDKPSGTNSGKEETKNDESKGDDGQENGGSSQYQTTYGSKKFDNVTITVELFDRSNAPEGSTITDNRWTKYAQDAMKEIGINLEFVAVPRGDEVTKMNTMMATGTAPTVLGTYTWAYARDFYNQGGTWDLSEFISGDDQAQNLKAYLGEECLGLGTNPDGSMYGVVAKRSTTAMNNIFIRQDWLDKLGLDVPTTPEELHDAIYKFVYENPDGEKNITGAIFNGLESNSTAKYNNVVWWAFSENCEDEKQRAVQEGFEFYADPGYREYLRYINQFYNEGLMSSEFYASTDEILQSKFVNNQLGFLERNVGFNVDILRGRLLQALKENNPEAEMVAIPGLKNANGKIYSPAYSNGGMSVFCPKTSSAEEVEAAITYLDWMAKEGGFTFYHGIEGEHFEYNDAGVPIAKDPDYNKTDKDWIRTDLFLIGNQGYFQTVDEFNQAIAADNPGWEEYTIADYENALAGEVVNSAAYIAAGEIETSTSNDFSLLKSQYMVQCITCAPDAFDGIYDEWLAQAETLGVKDILEERSATYDSVKQ